MEEELLNYFIDRLAEQLAYYQLYGCFWTPNNFGAVHHEPMPAAASSSFDPYCNMHAAAFQCQNNDNYQSFNNTYDFDPFNGDSWYQNNVGNEFYKTAPQANYDVSSWSTSDGFGASGDEEQDGDEGFGEFIEAFRPPVPKPGYVCNICYVPGHFIKYCPQAPEKTKTPYQGTKQCIGLFVCHKCKRRWKSDKSFAEVGQTCKKCHIVINPKKQFPLLDEPVQDGHCRWSTSTSHGTDAGNYRDRFVSRSSDKPASLTSDVFSCSSAFPTPSPSPFSVREFVFE